jgi:hypothetical protein
LQDTKINNQTDAPMTQPRKDNGTFYNVWTDEEIEILRQNYVQHGIRATRPLLPRHNDGSIRTKAYHLGLTRQQRTYTVTRSVQRKQRSVIAYTDEGVLTYPDVPTAAQHYGISNKTLYGLIKSGQVREGVSFDYLTD